MVIMKFDTFLHKIQKQLVESSTKFYGPDIMIKDFTEEALEELNALYKDNHQKSRRFAFAVSFQPGQRAFKVSKPSDVEVVINSVGFEEEDNGESWSQWWDFNQEEIYTGNNIDVALQSAQEFLSQDDTHEPWPDVSVENKTKLIEIADKTLKDFIKLYQSKYQTNIKQVKTIIDDVGDNIISIGVEVHVPSRLEVVKKTVHGDEQDDISSW